MATRSGRAVVAVVLLLGFGIGGIGAWWLMHARPRPGDFVDVVATADGGALVIRHELGSTRDFIEVRDGNHLRWRGLIPPYAGGPGTVAMASSPTVVTVRVVRAGKPFLFAFDTEHGTKIDAFDLIDDAGADPHAYTIPGLATVGDGVWSVEVLARPGGGARLIAVDLAGKRLAWKVDVVEPPTTVWIADQRVVAAIGTRMMAWRLVDGVATTAPGASPVEPSGGGTYVTADGFGFGGGGHTRYTVPSTAVRPQRYHLAGGHAWVIEPSKLTVLDGNLQPIATIAR